MQSGSSAPDCEGAEPVHSLAGPVTVKEVAEVGDSLAEALATAGAGLVLRIGEIGESDLTLVQLIESARKTAAQEGKSLRLAEPASGDLRKMLERGGFVADAAPDSRAFWLHEAVK